MNNDWLQQIIGLRTAAWAEVQTSPAYDAFKAFDDTVVRLGGAPLVAAHKAIATPMIRLRIPPPRANDKVPSRETHGDIAHMVLGTGSEPMSIHELFDAAKLFGADPKGANPLSNFRSAVSRDDRFVSVVRDARYYWWFSDKPLPSGWNEAAELSLNGHSAALSSPSYREGGGSHTTTDNTLT